MVKKYYCDICDRELGRPIDIKNVRIFPGSEKEINVELCIDCLAAKTIPNLVSDLLFPGENNPQNFNFNQFVGVAGEIRVNFGDVKSLLKKHPGDFDSIYYGMSEEEIKRIKDQLLQSARDSQNER